MVLFDWATLCANVIWQVTKLAAERMSESCRYTCFTRRTSVNVGLLVGHTSIIAQWSRVALLSTTRCVAGQGQQYNMRYGFNLIASH